MTYSRSIHKDPPIPPQRPPARVMSLAPSTARDLTIFYVREGGQVREVAARKLREASEDEAAVGREM